VAGLERANVRVYKFRGGGIRGWDGKLGTSDSTVLLREFPESATDKQKYGRSSKPARCWCET